MKLRALYADFGEPVLGQSDADLYELQRELQHLPGFPKGRPGPGGGADATPEAVALLLVALLVGGARRRVRRTTPAAMALPLRPSGAGTPEAIAGDARCLLTSARTFGDAIRELLADSALAGRVRQIIVCRDWGEAAIAWLDQDDRLHESRFADAEGDRRSAEAERRGTLFNLARMGGSAIADIARELRERGD